MNVISSSHSEMEVCWETGGGEGKKEGKGEKEEHVLYFYRDELIPVLSLGKEVICTWFCTLGCVVLKTFGHRKSDSLLHVSSACSVHRVNGFTLHQMPPDSSGESTLRAALPMFSPQIKPQQ